MAKRKKTAKVADSFYQARPITEDFNDERSRIEEKMWWESANDNIFFLDRRACPASWSFVVMTSDYWNSVDLRKSKAPALVSACPDFMKILSCGHYKTLFEYYDMGIFAYRKAHPRKAAKMWLAPRRSQIEQDLFLLWQAATTDSDKALPLSRCETPEDVARVLRKARRELGIGEWVNAYVKGTPAELLVRGCAAGMTIESIRDAYLAGVPEKDLFA